MFVFILIQRFFPSPLFLVRHRSIGQYSVPSFLVILRVSMISYFRNENIYTLNIIWKRIWSRAQAIYFDLIRILQRLSNELIDLNEWWPLLFIFFRFLLNLSFEELTPVKEWFDETEVYIRSDVVTTLIVFRLMYPLTIFALSIGQSTINF